MTISAARCSTPSPFLPEYGLTRADQRILDRHAARASARISDGRRIRQRIGAQDARRSRSAGVQRRISRSIFPAPALDRCRRELRGLARVMPIQASYLEGLSIRSPAKRRPKRRADPAAVSRQHHRQLRSALPVGFSAPGARPIAPRRRPVDRLRSGEAGRRRCSKPMTILPASPPSFNLNLLGRINRELGGDFNLRAFAHEARCDAIPNSASKCICGSRRPQTVTIRDSGFRCAFRCRRNDLDRILAQISS